MRNFKILLAGIKIEINCFYQETIEYCREYVADFEVPDVTISISKSDIETEGIVPAKIISEMGLDCPKTAFTYKYKEIEPFIVYRKIADALPMYDTVLMHGSVVSNENAGYMFMANSGVGKSTRTKLWLETYPNSVVINGDKPLVKVQEERVMVCGTPWCGKEGWNTNIAVPLKAILLLERADNRDDYIEEIGGSHALSKLLQHTYLNSENQAKVKTMVLLMKMVKKIRVYRYVSSPTHDSMRMAFEKISL